MLRGLYAITDQTLLPEQNFSAAVEAALRGGAKIIQYRDKSNDSERRQQQAKTLVKLCKIYHATSIINDDIELAFEVRANGVHLGLQDGSLQQARKRLGQQAIIGITCYNDLSRAHEAERQGANYVAFGRFFNSPTKPNASPANIELLQQARQQINLPICAIGGITEHNGSSLIEAGADLLAVVSGVFAGENIEQQSRCFSSLFADK